MGGDVARWDVVKENVMRVCIEGYIYRLTSKGGCSEGGRSEGGGMCGGGMYLGRMVGRGERISIRVE